CTIDFRCRLLHLEIILLKKPSRIALCNKAFKEYKTFMKRSGLVVAADKELIQMDIDSLKEEINGPNGKCK
ncbi:hypothetical protein ABLT95_18935, partial [Acinetobacter nosocomialis]